MQGNDGKPLDEHSLANFLDNRFKCYHCETVFCHACEAIPYHLGETCDQVRSELHNLIYIFECFFFPASYF